MWEMERRVREQRRGRARGGVWERWRDTRHSHAHPPPSHRYTHAPAHMPSAKSFCRRVSNPKNAFSKRSS